MYSHFSVILMCFSGVYCISTQIDNLDLMGLKQILNGEVIMEEWEPAMDQHILYELTGGPKTNVSVQQGVNYFMEKVNIGQVVNFETIQGVIKRAYQCTLAKYANLTAYLIVQDVLTIKANITEALNVMKQRGISYDRRSIMTNKIFMSFFKEASKKQLFHVDLDLIFRGRKILLHGKHDFVSSPSKEWHNILTDMIEKNFGFNIKHKFYPDVFGNKFTNESRLPDVHVLNEIYCVLNETIQLFDKFITNNCVQNPTSSVNYFQSLEQGLSNDVIKLTRYIDQKVAGGSLSWALYRNYSKPGNSPGTSQAVNDILASGCFVDNVEFEISGLKMDLPNTIIPSEIYGNRGKRSSEFTLKFTESYLHHENVIKAGMVSICDDENWMADQLSGDTSAGVTGI